MDIKTFGPFVRFFIDILLVDSFSTDLLVFENCLLEFKKNHLNDLRQNRSIKQESLVVLDEKLRLLQAEYERLKSDDIKSDLEKYKIEKEKLVHMLKQIDNQIGILDLTIDKFWDEIFSTYDWIIEKEKLGSDFDDEQLKGEVEYFKSKIDTLLDR